MLKVLRSKNGGHVYHVVSEKKRGENVTWLVKRPDDEMFEAWLPKAKVLELAVEAWEFSDDLMNAAIELKNQLVIHDLVGYNVYTEVHSFIEDMREVRLEGAKAKGEER